MDLTQFYHTGPTQLELRLYRALAALHVPYEEQVYFPPFTVDAFLTDYGVAIEVDGCRAHGCVPCGYGYNRPDEPGRRLRRDTCLTDKYGLAVFHLPGHSMRTDEEAVLEVRTLFRYQRIPYVDPRDPPGTAPHVTPPNNPRIRALLERTPE
jgi:hypothetical protein